VDSVAVPSNALTVRVYWEDTDAGGVVYYANYLRFFERARTEWLRGLGVEQGRLQALTDSIFVVAEVQVRYLSPARLDDQITLSVQVLERGRASLYLLQKAWRGDVLLAEGRVRIGCVRGSTLKPCRIPQQVMDALQLG
jgi:acyl-CoA thioester hydrolase